jgi:TIR domain-containing protein
MSAKIFISYRRDDSAGHAGRVTDRLEREFGRDLLFMDVDAIPLGTNFVKVLHEEVAKCGALLAVIGPDWLDVRDDDGKRRLDNPNDFVRIEIAAALQRDIPVIPILLDGAKMPRANLLPDDLKELATRNGLDVRHASFHDDVEKLIRGLKRTIIAPSKAETVAEQAIGQERAVGRDRAVPDGDRLARRPPLIHTVSNEEITKFDPKAAELMRMGPATSASTRTRLKHDLNRPALVIGALVIAAAILGAFFWLNSSPGVAVKPNAPEIQLKSPSDDVPLAPNTKFIR